MLSFIFVNGVQLEVRGSESRWDGDKMREKLTNVMLMVGSARDNIIYIYKKKKKEAYMNDARGREKWR